ncbi:hypothetical protein QN355_06320 [Cryobacterium sp. 10S3]|uniref:hypothetical protein n=1 Tax=Cryobacterium sp. 10S3 TaxID=3048582 RepID=UPI002AC98405|nr:hypothetical protein [Cryobacterium sp. 10S3]MEB0286163.1 hypothetical protein [Cryobacterium sp. 10S3]WPX12221.1 hypothetical protein RHM57_11060 [Cryobacterium sp. 10S3]
MAWPITPAELRNALGYTPEQGDELELELIATGACERIDSRTGRDIEPNRHLKADGTLPVIFTLAARETAKLWWQQSKNGPRGQAPDPGADGAPRGIDLPRKVEGWLGDYPPPPGIA